MLSPKIRQNVHIHPPVKVFESRTGLPNQNGLRPLTSQSLIIETVFFLMMEMFPACGWSSRKLRVKMIEN